MTLLLDYLVYILVGIVALVVWLVYSSQKHCPSCGLELTDTFMERLDYEFYGDIPTRCRYCGWQRESN